MFTLIVVSYYMSFMLATDFTSMERCHAARSVIIYEYESAGIKGSSAFCVAK